MILHLALTQNETKEIDYDFIKAHRGEIKV